MLSLELRSWSSKQPDMYLMFNSCSHFSNWVAIGRALGQSFKTSTFWLYFSFVFLHTKLRVWFQVESKKGHTEIVSKPISWKQIRYHKLESFVKANFRAEDSETNSRTWEGIASWDRPWEHCGDHVQCCSVTGCNEERKEARPRSWRISRPFKTVGFFVWVFFGFFLLSIK